ncbi:MAG: S-layer homology domain-containing protein, partial [Acidimicrobiia bacterium]|nr:S-layer homology domain-containing protein [Acidimicrobiia bacterium]
MLRRVGLGAVIVVMAGAFMFMGLQRVSAAASCFTDVDDAAWYEPYVCAMATINVLTGYPDGSFNPNGNITRAEVAVVADRLVNNSVVNAGTLDGIDSV